MPVLSIIEYPDPRLKLVAEPVTIFDAMLAKNCADMLETMSAEDGVGLAATQVDIQQQILVIDISPDRNQPLCLINPRLIDKSGEQVNEEGCLSFPGIFAKVKRFAQITVEYQDINGTLTTLTADTLMAICVQHEIDHLQGITFFDHLSSLKQNMIRKKLQKSRTHGFREQVE